MLWDFLEFILILLGVSILAFAFIAGIIILAMHYL